MLLDHFRPPLSLRRHWESFHAAWAGSLADDLNRRLPSGYFAEEQTHAGPGAEIDVATFENYAEPPRHSANGPSTSSASVALAVWAPPAPTLTIPALFADDFEVRILSNQIGPSLVAAIELISPRNKDRSESRRAFAVKCAGYLHQGVSLLIVDIVTNRRADLHRDILGLLNPRAVIENSEASASPQAVAYQPVRRQNREEIDIWLSRFQVGDALPTLPLAIAADQILPIDLEASYHDACRRRRLAE